MHLEKKWGVGGEVLEPEHQSSSNSSNSSSEEGNFELSLTDETLKQTRVNFNQWNEIVLVT